MKTKVSRRAHFNAAHRLHNPNWSDARNKEVFGLCNNPNYHGHNYDLIVSVVGEVDPETGYLMDMKILKDLIKSEVENHLDHKNLNKDVADFSTLIPTAENIAKVIYDRLRPHIDQSKEIEVVLYETPRNFVTYPVK